MAINFPDSPTTNDLFTSGGKTWEYDGTAWTIKAATTSIATGSITYDKLASDAVTTVKIADGAITAAKIADGTVVAAEIASSAITTDKINNLAVTTAKIAAGAVTAAKLGNDISLTPADGSITQAKLGTTLSAVTVTTAANRDIAVASPFTGQLVFLTDTKKIQVWDGTSWLNITLAPPETPTSLSATALSTTSVSIAFTAGGANGSPITNYKYALSTNGGSTYGSFIAVDPADATTPITISGLTAGTTYYIKLKAVNDMGDSVASAAVSIGTLATPDAPTSLSATAGATSITISFTPGAQGGSAITNYQYALSTNGGSTYGSFTALDPADATSPITITGLTAGTAYYVKLKAVNTDGAGLESSAVSVTTLNPSPTVDYLVVAGGGGGTNSGYCQGGGGGAGGLRSTVTATGGGGTLESALAVTSGNSYTVTVGSGGNGGSYDVGTPTAGSNSVFATITSVGGAVGITGGGTPVTGGSGAGSSPYNSTSGGAGTANQGFAGGAGSGDSSNGIRSAGGGGGAGGVGAAGASYDAGNGGVGVAVAITGSSVYYAGGGGGGAMGYAGAPGGNGGGGAGAANGSVIGSSGTVNTGGGAGGGSQNNDGVYNCSSGGTGGSGVVILRYSNAYDNITTIGAGLTYTFTNTGGYKIYRFTAGTGSITI